MYVYVCVYAYMCMYVCITYWGGIVLGEMSYPKQEGELSGGNCPGGIVLHPLHIHTQVDTFTHTNIPTCIDK